MSERIPPFVRPALFASVELGLSLVSGLRKTTSVDLDSVTILMCVSSATLSPIMLDPGLRREYGDCETIPESLRGAISRRAIAERTGLPRETVRRKVADLCAKGLLVVDENDRVRSPPGRLMEPMILDMLRTVNESIAQYEKRLAEFGVTVPPVESWPASQPEPRRAQAG